MRKLILPLALMFTLTACSETEINSTIKTFENITDTTKDVVETGKKVQESLNDIEEKLTQLEGSIGEVGINGDKTFVSTVKNVIDGDTVEIYMEDPISKTKKNLLPYEF